MLVVLFAATFSLILALLGTPMLIRLLVKRGYGQFIRDDGPTSHHTKRGTPTMGGLVIIGASLLAYALAHLAVWSPVTPSGLLVLFLMTGLGIVGFLDDYIKISKQRSLGLNSKQKLAGQILVAVIFSVLALRFPDERGITPASTAISFVRDTGFDLAAAGGFVGLVLFVLWANLMIAGTSNGVNLTDGLDGLALLRVHLVEIARGAGPRGERARRNASRRGGRGSGFERGLFRRISQEPAFFRESWIKNGIRGRHLREPGRVAKMVVQNSGFPPGRNTGSPLPRGRTGREFATLSTVRPRGSGDPGP